MTGGRQAPTTIIPRSIPDFPIAVAVNVTVSTSAAENVSVNVSVQRETNVPAVAQPSPTSAGNALISIGRKVYQLDREMNKTEFNRFLDFKLYKRNELPQSHVQSLMSNSNVFALTLYDKGISNHKIGNCMLFPVGIPGTIIKSYGSTQMREAVDMYNSSINQIDVSQMMFDYNYDKGKKRNRIGNICLWSGIGVGVVGGWILPRYVFPSEYKYGDRYNPDTKQLEYEYEYLWNWRVGFIPLIAGGAIILTSIPLKINGKHLMRPSIETFSRTGMKLNVGITGNGVGLVLRF